MSRPTSIVRKQMGQIKKLFGLWPKNKRRTIIERELNPATDVSKEGIPQFLNRNRGIRTEHVTRRQIVLNRHFTEILSDILANDFKSELDRLGITITSIETKAWNKGVSIFYYIKDKPYDEKIANDLKALVVHLRAAITERQLIGRTPYVNFIYDQSVLIERSLDEALSGIRLKDEESDSVVTKDETTHLYISKNLGSQEQILLSNRFSAPKDMNNCMLGVDYPKLYDEVVSKLAKGRGESSRIVGVSNTLMTAKPLFKGPPENQDELDPTTRLLRMRKFLISQKQKQEHTARLRRKDEILARESVQWEKDNERGDDELDFKMTPDLHCEDAEKYYDLDVETVANKSEIN